MVPFKNRLLYSPLGWLETPAHFAKACMGVTVEVTVSS